MMTEDTQFQKKIFTSKNVTAIPMVLGAIFILSDIASFIVSLIITDAFLDIFSGNNFGHYAEITRTHGNLSLILGVIVTIIFYNKGLYTNRTPWWSQVQYITKIISFSILIHTTLTIALHLHESLFFILGSWILSFLLIILSRAVIYSFANVHPSWKVPAVIISEESTSEDLLYAFHSDISTGYAVHTIFIRSPEENSQFSISNLPVDAPRVRICYGQEDHSQFIKENPNNLYIISLDIFRDSSREDLLRTLSEANAPYAIVPTLSRANLYQMEPKYFFGHDVVMLYVNNSAPTVLRITLEKIVKRAMDIIVSGLGLLFIAPIIGILAVLLKMEGQGGTLFYGGRRIGKGGKFFSCWKLRSMEPNSDHLLQAYLDSHPDLKADWEKYRKLPNDPRITTKTARFIRKASLDELPQIWNIFVGDMSLVGPRPILEDEVSYFEADTLNEYLSVRPGLTGLWQVSGRNKTSFKRRVYWDSWYVRNWSLWGDIVILIKTPIVLLTRKGAS